MRQFLLFLKLFAIKHQFSQFSKLIYFLQILFIYYCMSFDEELVVEVEYILCAHPTDQKVCVLYGRFTLMLDRDGVGFIFYGFR